MISPRMLLACFWALLILVVPITSRADIALSFMPTEEAKFLIKGEGYAGIVSVFLTVDYDTTYLSTPEVTVTGGKLLQGTALDAIPGRIHLNIRTEDQSPVFEACLFFQKLGDYPAVINFVTAEASDPNGTLKSLPVAMLANPNLPRQSTGEPVEIGADNQGLPGVNTGGHKE